MDWNRLAWTDISLDVFDGYFILYYDIAHIMRFFFILCHPTIIQYLRTEFGAPMNRPRFYLLLVRRDLMQADAKADFPSFVNGMLEKMKHYTEFDWILSSTWWVKKVHKYLTGLDWFNGMLKKLLSILLRTDLLMPRDHWAVHQHVAQRESVKRLKASLKKKFLVINEIPWVRSIKWQHFT